MMLKLDTSLVKEDICINIIFILEFIPSETEANVSWLKNNHVLFFNSKIRSSLHPDVHSNEITV